MDSGVWVCSFTSAVCVCVVPVCGFLAMVFLLFWHLMARFSVLVLPSLQQSVLLYQFCFSCSSWAEFSLFNIF